MIDGAGHGAFSRLDLVGGWRERIVAPVPSPSNQSWDAIVVGAGHNGLVAATLLARAGLRVVVLERGAAVGGAAVSASPFAGLDVRLSRYSYLVSLFPHALLEQLGLELTLRERRVSSYTPWGESGILVSEDRSSLGDDAEAFADFYAMTTAVAERVFGSMTEPLRSRAEFRRLVGDPWAWSALFERPLAETLEARFRDDVVRGIVATDGLIGTFASLADPSLLANRCFLYHVIGNGTGRWDVPVGGMGALTRDLARAANEAGAELRTGTPVTDIEATGDSVLVRTADGETYRGRDLLSNAAPAVLAELLGEPAPDDPAPEGSQLKLNLLLERLPRLRDPHVSPEEGFAGTLHVNESYAQLESAYVQASQGQVPGPAPCEAYCHSLTDPSILGRELREAGAQTLTVFGLHMPARLFAGDARAAAAAKQQAVAATLRSLNSVLAEPIEDCLMKTADGAPCLEARTPPELESELGLPAGHIFHRDLAWPFAESDDEVGSWGVQTRRHNVWICGAGARRGGGVSGIPGHNAARAVLAARG
jgi:phytoene dehydrogenase-like protein